jgi:hypothetical protein
MIGQIENDLKEFTLKNVLTKHRSIQVKINDIDQNFSSKIQQFVQEFNLLKEDISHIQQNFLIHLQKDFTNSLQKFKSCQLKYELNQRRIHDFEEEIKQQSEIFNSNPLFILETFQNQLIHDRVLIQQEVRKLLKQDARSLKGVHREFQRK